MNDNTGTPLMPESFEAEWNGVRFWYQERCRVPDDKDIQKVLSQTEYSLNLMFEEADLPEECDVDVDVHVGEDGDEVIAKVEMKPGKPDGHVHLGVASLTS